MPTPSKIQVSCPSCGHRLSAPAESAGKSGRCPKCGERFTVPASATQEAQPADDRAAKARQPKPAGKPNVPSARAERERTGPTDAAELERHAREILSEGDRTDPAEATPPADDASPARATPQGDDADKDVAAKWNEKIRRMKSRQAAFEPSRSRSPKLLRVVLIVSAAAAVASAVFPPFRVRHTTKSEEFGALGNVGYMVTKTRVVDYVDYAPIWNWPEHASIDYLRLGLLWLGIAACGLYVYRILGSQTTTLALRGAVGVPLLIAVGAIVWYCLMNYDARPPVDEKGTIRFSPPPQSPEKAPEKVTPQVGGESPDLRFANGYLVSDLNTGLIIAYRNTGSNTDVAPTGRATEHTVNGKVVARSSHLIEGVKGKDGAGYTLYIRDGRVNAIGKIPPQAPPGSDAQLLWVEADG
jgi:hypothetical protein